MHYIVEVEGFILAKEGNQYAVDWVSGGDYQDLGNIEDNYSYVNHHYIRGNLVLDKNKRALPYALYITNKDIISGDKSDIVSFGAGPGPAFAFFCDTLQAIKAKLTQQVGENIYDSFYNGLYIECFSSLELFLSDYILCLCFSYDSIRLKIKEYISNKGDREFSDIKVRNFFTKSFIFHRFEEVNALFKWIDVDFSINDNLFKLLRRRSNIVHRNAFSSIDGIKRTNATKEVITELVEECYDIIDRLKSVSYEV